MRAKLGLPVDPEGGIFLQNCFFYPSEWPDCVSGWMGQELNTPTLLSVHLQADGCSSDLCTLTCVCYRPRELHMNYNFPIH